MPDNIISVVAGGASVRAIDLHRIPGLIIAVNDSAMHLPRWDIAVSMDRLWTEYRFDALRRFARPAHLRRSAMQNLSDKWPWLEVFECDHTSVQFSEQRGVLNGTNSGLCAFNLAYQIRPTQILLFGFDMQRHASGAAYWHDPYPWSAKGATTSGKYAAWSQQFAAAKRACDASGIAVSVVGDSAIEVFDRVAASEFRRRDVA